VNTHERRARQEIGKKSKKVTSVKEEFVRVRYTSENRGEYEEARRELAVATKERNELDEEERPWVREGDITLLHTDDQVKKKGKGVGRSLDQKMDLVDAGLEARCHNSRLATEHRLSWMPSQSRKDVILTGAKSKVKPTNPEGLL
jgi:hypothetical protein